jgi:ABC-2 type transport system permease protein
MGLFNLSIGCLASSLTANQIVAAVVSFTASLMHFLVGAFILYFQRAGQKAFVDFVYYIASVQHIETFTNGLLDTRPLVYYTSMSLLFLVLTHQVLEFRRWRV